MKNEDGGNEQGHRGQVQGHSSGDWSSGVSSRRGEATVSVASVGSKGDWILEARQADYVFYIRELQGALMAGRKVKYGSGLLHDYVGEVVDAWFAVGDKFGNRS
jgi:hypothetical protein